MPQFLFRSDSRKNFIAVPASVVDRHLASCSGDDLKVLLFLLRKEDVSFDETEIARQTGVAPEAVAGCVDFWLRAGVLHRLGGALSLSGDTASGSMPVFSAASIAARSTQDKALAELFSQAERIRRKALSPAEINALYTLYDHIGLPASVIAELLEYCEEAGKKGSQYLYTTGAAWAQEGVDTADAAAEKIAALKRAKDLEGRVVSALGLGRVLSGKERAFLQTWSQSFGYGLEEIVYAFETTVDNTGKVSFSYMNKILQSSFESGCRSAQEMREATRKAPLKKPSRPKKNNSQTPSSEGMFQPFWEVTEK